MANPFHDPGLRHAQAKCLADKVVPEAVDSSMLKPNLASCCWKLWRQRMDDVAKQDRADDVGLQSPSTWPVEN